MVRLVPCSLGAEWVDTHLRGLSASSARPDACSAATAVSAAFGGAESAKLCAGASAHQDREEGVAQHHREVLLQADAGL